MANDNWTSEFRTTAHALHLEGSYENAVKTGNCSNFLSELGDIPINDTEIVFSKLAAVNHALRSKESSLPEVSIKDNGFGGARFEFEGCLDK